MYTITFKGMPPAGTNITKARIYFASDPSFDVDVSPGVEFTFTHTTPNPGDYPLQYSWVNVNGEGPKRAPQNVHIDDMATPLEPTGDLQVVSVVWA